MGTLHTLAVALVLLGSPSPTTPAAPELTIQVESLGLRFEAPSKWRLSRESTPEQLVFYPGKTKTTPVLRVRAFQGDLSAEDRLAAMTRGLPEEESKAHFVSAETWAHEGRRFETATVATKEGAQEWDGSLTLVTQPRRVQHAFWLFGRKKDVEREWESIRASIVSATVIKRVEVDDDSPAVDRESPQEAPAVWTDAKCGLRVGSWPAGFAPVAKSLGSLAKEGVTLEPTDERAHDSTSFLLQCARSAKQNTSMDAAAALHAELGTKSAVSDLRRLPLRIDGVEAALLKWSEEVGGDDFVHEVHFVQKDDRAFRFEYTAEESWAGMRSRRDLVKDFIAGIAFD